MLRKQQEKQLPLNSFDCARAAAALEFPAAAAWTGIVAANLASNSAAGDGLVPAAEPIRRRPSAPQAVEVNQRHWKTLQQLGAFSGLHRLTREFLRIGRNGKYSAEKRFNLLLAGALAPGSRSRGDPTQEPAGPVMRCRFRPRSVQHWRMGVIALEPQRNRMPMT